MVYNPRETLRMSGQNPFSDNPYQAPAYSVPDEYQNEPARDWTLGWILFSFDGRIPRRVYWGATIGSTVVFYGIIFAAAFLGGTLGDSGMSSGAAPAEAASAFVGLVLLVLFIPMIWISLAIQVKRWHDRGKSGWWVLINLIPWIGALWAFIETGCLRGDHGPNQYGADQT